MSCYYLNLSVAAVERVVCRSLQLGVLLERFVFVQLARDVFGL